MQGLTHAKQKISGAKTIVIASHINPDGDSIGSLLSLGLALKQLGKQVYMVSRDGVPANYKRLPGARFVLETTSVKADLAIAVDCSDRKMLGETFEIFQQAKSILEIDHHRFKKPFGDIVLLDTQASAVGEILYILFKELKIGITKDIAQNIMTSLVVETHSFRLPSTRSFTFKVCADLIDKGVDLYKLAEMVYWTKSKESAFLLSRAIKRCKFIHHGEVAWSILKENDFKGVKGNQEAADSIVDELRAIKDVRIAVLFKEKNKDLLRVSLRSKGAINVGRLAEKYGGGGHYDASGCHIQNSKNSIIQFINSVKELL